MIRIRLTVTSESLVRLDVNFRHRLLTVPVDCPKGMRFKIVELCARIDRMNAAHVGEIEDYRCELIRQKQKSDAECGRARAELEFLRVEHNLLILRSQLARAEREIEMQNLMNMVAECQQMIETQGRIIQATIRKRAPPASVSSILKEYEAAWEDLRAMLHTVPRAKLLMIQVIELVNDIRERVRAIMAVHETRVCLRV